MAKKSGSIKRTYNISSQNPSKRLISHRNYDYQCDELSGFQSKNINWQGQDLVYLLLLFFVITE